MTINHENYSKVTGEQVFYTRSKNSIFNYIADIEEELIYRKYEGKVIFDNLLHTGMNDERFYELYFNGEKFVSSETRVRIVESIEPHILNKLYHIYPNYIVRNEDNINLEKSEIELILSKKLIDRSV